MWNLKVTKSLTDFGCVSFFLNVALKSLDEEMMCSNVCVNLIWALRSLSMRHFLRFDILLTFLLFGSTAVSATVSQNEILKIKAELNLNQNSWCKSEFCKVEADPSISFCPVSQCQLKLNSMLKWRPQLQGLQHFLPPTYHIHLSSDNSRLFDLLERIHLDILATTTGQKICRDATRGSTALLRQAIFPFTPGENLRRAEQLCSTRWLEKPFSTSGLMRLFAFVFYPTDPPFYQSWTNKHNGTLLSLKESQFNRDHLYTALIHELLVQLDSKKDLSISSRLSEFTTEENYCSIGRALSNPFIHFGLMSLRALQLEDQIKFELGLIKHNTRVKANPCAENVLGYYKQLIEGHTIMSLNSGSEYLISNFSCPAAESRDRFSQIEEDIDALRKTTVKGQPENSLCQFIVEPEFKRWSVPSIDPGPRSRIGEP